jgi:hypothetical protein
MGLATGLPSMDQSFKHTARQLWKPHQSPSYRWTDFMWLWGLGVFFCWKTVNKIWVMTLSLWVKESENKKEPFAKKKKHKEIITFACGQGKPTLQYWQAWWLIRRGHWPIYKHSHIWYICYLLNTHTPLNSTVHTYRTVQYHVLQTDMCRYQSVIYNTCSK